MLYNILRTLETKYRNDECRFLSMCTFKYLLEGISVSIRKHGDFKLLIVVYASNALINHVMHVLRCSGQSRNIF